MSIVRYFVMILLVLEAVSLQAFAHKPSDSYLRISRSGPELTAEWDIALKDLELLVGLDADHNGEITWGELKAQRPAIEAHVLSRLKFTEGEVDALTAPAESSSKQLVVTDFRVSQHSDGAYATLLMRSDWPDEADPVTVHYRLLFDVDPTHRGLVLFNDGVSIGTHVLSPESPVVTLRVGSHSMWQAFVEYVREGVWHIWIGLDHILFLVALLIPAVLIRTDSGWEQVAAFRPAWESVLKVVTMFTLAHSITLWLAVMEYVTLPSQWVESAIALSIVVTVINNLYPMIRLPGWAIAFGFGLIHGFGFANVLLDLGLSSTALALSLFGFNLGVELGQLAIVLTFLPMAYLLRATAFYRWGVMRAGSVLVGVIACIWMYERLFNVELAI